MIPFGKQQRIDVPFVEDPHFTRNHTHEVQLPDPPSHQSQRREAYRRRHFSHLPVLSLSKDHPDPAGGYPGTVTDRWMPVRYGWRRWKNFDRAWAGSVRFAVDGDRYSHLQLAQGDSGEGAFHLYPIFPLVREPRIQQPVIQGRVIGQDQQSFTVEIQPADRIAIRRNREKILQRTLLFL